MPDTLHTVGVLLPKVAVKPLAVVVTVTANAASPKVLLVGVAAAKATVWSCLKCPVTLWLAVTLLRVQLAVPEHSPLQLLKT